MTTRAPAVLKNESVFVFDQCGTSGFSIPLANSINTASRKEKHVFVILVLDDHVLRKHGSRVYVVVVTLDTYSISNLPRLNEKGTSSTASLAM